MHRKIYALVFTVVFSFTLAAKAELPKPAALEPQVNFWKRIYSEVETSGGLIHDSRHLDVVYEKIVIPEGLSRRSRERHTDAKKKRWVTALRALAKGKRTNLTTDEQRVLSLWPEGVSNHSLSEGAKNIRFQLGQANKFRDGLVRSGAWEDFIAKTFSDKSLPVELTALPHVESSFNPRAYSHVGAAGLWQFTRSTGRRFLKIDYVIDERMDPFKASEAAAKLLAHNYEQTGTWPLAITAYNHGTSGMRRAKRKLGTNDIVVVIDNYKSRTFGFASRNFYTELLAAWEVSQNSERYFGTIQKDGPRDFESVTLDAYYPASQVAKTLGVSIDTLRDHNLALRIPIWKGEKYLPKNYQLWIPREPNRTSPAQDLLASIPAKQRFSKQRRDDFYRVHRGDTISTIAKRFGVSERKLINANGLRNPNRIRIGQVLRLPGSSKTRSTPIVRKEAPPSSGRYTVRRGDSIYLIAKRFDLSEKEIIAANGLRNKNRIHVGQVLQLPTQDGTVEAQAKTVIASTAKPAASNAKSAPKPAKPEVKPNPVIAETTKVASVESELAPPAKAADAPMQVVEASTLVEIPPTLKTPNTSTTPEQLRESPNGLADEAIHVFYEVGPNDRIEVEAGETIGHYAEWLELRASDLRRVNGIAYGTPLVVGEDFRLDFSRVTEEVFERRRIEYHRAIQQDFYSMYRVGEAETYTLKRGETLWAVSRKKGEVPFWLLRQYNPELDLSNLQPGMQLNIPAIEEIATTNQ